MKLKKIKIVGDGTSRGTKVLDSETGEMMPAVQKVEFSIERGMVGLVRITQIVKLDGIDVDGWVDAREMPPADAT